MNTSPLADCRILITRPAGRQQTLRDEIEAGGGEAVSLPLLAIEPASDTAANAQLKEKLARLHQYDTLIFVSVNAVRFGAQRIVDCDAAISREAEILAVGTATAQNAALQFERPVNSPAAGSGSEQLLEVSQLEDVKGRKIAIFRGEGGRELLATELGKRGAQVDYFEVYRRMPAPGAAEQLAEILANGPPHYVILTSAEALMRWGELLEEIAGRAKRILFALPLMANEGAEHDRYGLFRTPVVVPSRRVADLAAQHGFTEVIDAGDAGAKVMVEALAADLRQRET